MCPVTVHPLGNVNLISEVPSFVLTVEKWKDEVVSKIRIMVDPRGTMSVWEGGPTFVTVWLLLWRRGEQKCQPSTKITRVHPLGTTTIDWVLISIHFPAVPQFVRLCESVMLIFCLEGWRLMKRIHPLGSMNKLCEIWQFDLFLYFKKVKTLGLFVVVEDVSDFIKVLWGPWTNAVMVPLCDKILWLDKFFTNTLLTFYFEDNTCDDHRIHVADSSPEDHELTSEYVIVWLWYFLYCVNKWSDPPGTMNADDVDGINKGHLDVCLKGTTSGD